MDQAIFPMHPETELHDLGSAFTPPTPLQSFDGSHYLHSCRIFPHSPYAHWIDSAHSLHLRSLQICQISSERRVLASVSLEPPRTTRIRTVRNGNTTEPHFESRSGTRVWQNGADSRVRQPRHGKRFSRFIGALSPRKITHP